MSTQDNPVSDVTDVLNGLASLFEKPAFQAALPVVITLVADLAEGGAAASNPLLSAQFLATLVSQMPVIEPAVLQAGVALFGAINAAIKPKAAEPAPVPVVEPVPEPVADPAPVAQPAA